MTAGLFRARQVAAVVSLVVGGPLFVLALAGQFGRASALLDVINHFAPVVATMSLVVMAISVLGPQGALRRLSIAFSAGALAISGFQMAPELMRAWSRTDRTAPASEPLTLVLFNAWVENAKSEEASEWILKKAPDIVVLIEGRRLRDRLIDAGYRPACNGCAPIILARRAPLRRYPPAFVWNDPNRVTTATYTDNRGAFTVIGVHGRWPMESAALSSQRRFLATRMNAEASERLIVAGDFNSTPWSFARRREDREWGLIRRTVALPTWPAARLSHNPLPAPFPYLPIDHVYAGPGWATVRVERGPALGSDHYPVVVTLAPVATSER